VTSPNPLLSVPDRSEIPLLDLQRTASTDWRRAIYVAAPHKRAGSDGAAQSAQARRDVLQPDGERAGSSYSRKVRMVNHYRPPPQARAGLPRLATSPIARFSLAPDTPLPPALSLSSPVRSSL
jgi:hypothetical protein